MEHTVKIKICGLMSLEDVAAVNEAKPEYAGFVLAKSRRRISREHARLLRMELDPSVTAVGVFVNELPQIVAGYLEDGIIDVAQLHGQEDERYIHRLRCCDRAAADQGVFHPHPRRIWRRRRRAARTWSCWIMAAGAPGSVLTGSCCVRRSVPICCREA